MTETPTGARRTARCLDAGIHDHDATCYRTPGWRVVEWTGRQRHVRTLAVLPTWREAVDYAHAQPYTENTVIGWIPADATTVRRSTLRGGRSDATLVVKP